MNQLSFAVLSLALVLEACAAPPPKEAVAVPAPPVHLTSGAINAEPLDVGSVAPDFEAVAQDDKSVHLQALHGRPVVLFFYTQDETPQSTREASDLRDEYTDLADQGAVVIGVSHDSKATHEAFAKNHRLPFELVSDESGDLARAYGVPDPYGVCDRQTFVINREGKVTSIYRNVDVARHAIEVLADVRK